jgi:integrase
MGRLYKRGDTYYADYFDRNGIRRRESTRTADPKVARARLRDLELATTDRAAHPTETLAAALTYFTKVVHAASPAGTVRCYKQKARHLSQKLGDELLDRLTREDVDRYIAARIDEGAHTHSVHKELVVLRGALKSARDRDRFHGALEIVPKFEAGYVPRTTYLTPDQFLLLVDHLVPPAPAKAKPRTLARREERRSNRALYCVLIAFASPRRGELESLQWEHVDLDRNTLRIPEGKTYSRVVKIHPVLRPWLEGMHGGTGPMLEPWSNVTRDLANAAVRAKLPMTSVTPNDLRRTFASWLVQAGVSLYVVSRLLGHKTTRMVEMVYGQLDDATLAAAIGKLPDDPCAAGVPRAVPNPGTVGGSCNGAPLLTIVNSVEESFVSRTSAVPRVGIEPTTRGFSVLKESAPKPKRSARLLRLVR